MSNYVNHRVLITCTDNGRLSYWPDEQEKVNGLYSCDVSDFNPAGICIVHVHLPLCHTCMYVTCVRSTTKTGCSVGSRASCVALSRDTPLLVATGGKENDLKIWDGTTLVFQAKNVRSLLTSIVEFTFPFLMMVSCVRSEMISWTFEFLSG